MAITQISNPTNYLCLACDVKPNVPLFAVNEGSTLLETDTGHRYVYRQMRWSLEENPNAANRGTTLLEEILGGITKTNELLTLFLED